MTKRDRDDLLVIARQREKLAKATADARAAEMRAEFERQLSAKYSFDQTETWRRAYQRAEAVVKQAQQEIAEESKKLGIPAQFAPELHISWYGRGENASKERRTELRALANARITAITKDFKHHIEARFVEIRERLITGSLESEEARTFLESMPKASDLMPLLSIEDVRRDTGLPPLLQ
jgi:hypothetical protein